MFVKFKENIINITNFLSFTMTGQQITFLSEDRALNCDFGDEETCKQAFEDILMGISTKAHFLSLDKKQDGEFNTETQ